MQTKQKKIVKGKLALRKSQNRYSQKNTRWNTINLLNSVIAIFIIVLLVGITGIAVYDLRSRAAPAGWVGNSRDDIKNSSWFTVHAYEDCPQESGGYWPTSRVDCLIDEPAGGPSVADQTIAKDPLGLYYKHLLPTDFFPTIPGLLLTINFSNLNKQTLESTLQQAVESNPTAYANISVDSLYIGLANGINGTQIESVSLMVHPQLERPIANAIGVLQRAKNLYKPFIEGATGGTISDSDLEEVYTAALNRCGQNALQNDQSGRGVYKIIGNYAVIVQVWDTGTPSLSATNDCNIHVVQLNSPNSPSPTTIVPTYACLGTSCTPTATLAPSVNPVVSPSVEPSLVISPTNDVTPSIPVSNVPNPSPPDNTLRPQQNNLFSFIMQLIKEILEFLFSLFKG